MSIIIAADTVPTIRNFDLFSSGNVEALFGKELIDIFGSADKRIINLELPLADKDSPIKKNGPSLRAPKSTIIGYKQLGVDAVSIANNHIMDHGEEGLYSTLESLDSNAIDYFGAGENIAEAEKPYVFELGGRKVGVFSCAEHEFSIASDKCAGANPFDALETPDKIAALKADCDFVVVLYHGGRELYRYPSPELQKRCRKMADKGADLVVCQHSHCIGCEEKYNNSTIVYGQGNFLFDLLDAEGWKTGLLIKLNDDLSVSYIPTVKHGNVVRKATKEEEKDILGEFYKRSEEIKSPGFIDSEFGKLANSFSLQYRMLIYGKRSFLLKAINKITGHRFFDWCFERKFSSQQLRRIRNVVECEAHRELFLEWISRH